MIPTAHEYYRIGFLAIEVFSLEIVAVGIFIMLTFILADAMRHGCCMWHREAFGKIGVKVLVAWCVLMVMDNMRQFCNDKMIAPFSDLSITR